MDPGTEAKQSTAADRFKPKQIADSQCNTVCGVVGLVCKNMEVMQLVPKKKVVCQQDKAVNMINIII